MDDDTVQENSIETQVAPEPSADSQAQTPAQSRNEYNWKAARERQKELERELKLQREFNERLLQAQAANNPVKQEIDDLDEISDEDFLPKGKQKKLVQKETQKLQQEIAQLKQSVEQQKQANMITSLQSRYPDFSQVVNQETLALFEMQEPELAKTIGESNDPYKVLMQSYKYIKALGISEPVDNKRVKEVEKKLQQNAKTVQSPQAFDKRPMAQAFKMTEDKDEQKRIYQEMMSYASKVGYGY